MLEIIISIRRAYQIAINNPSGLTIALMSRLIPKAGSSNPVHPISTSKTRQFALETAPASPDLYSFQAYFTAVAVLLASMSFNEAAL